MHLVSMTTSYTGLENDECGYANYLGTNSCDFTGFTRPDLAGLAFANVN